MKKLVFFLGLVLLIPTVYCGGGFFSPYKDVTINLNWNTNEIGTKVTGKQSSFLSVAPTELEALTWAFATGTCTTESWGGVSASDLVSANVASFVAANMSYVISTGGAGGGFTCDSPTDMKAFIDRYASPSLVGIDFDIEGDLFSSQQIDNLVTSVAGAQQHYPNLRYSFTLATLAASDGSQSSLNELGTAVVQAIKATGMSNYLINLMTMDYDGPGPDVCVVGSNGRCDMGLSAIQAAKNFNAIFNVPFQQIEVTLMIGMNDSTDEITSLSDIDTITSWGSSVQLAGYHFWSFDRDTPCSQSRASATCSSTSAPPLAYNNQFLGLETAAAALLTCPNLCFLIFSLISAAFCI